MVWLKPAKSSETPAVLARVTAPPEGNAFAAPVRSKPPLMVVPPVYQFVFDKVSVPTPTLTRDPPLPLKSPMLPENSVLRLLLPTVRDLEPSVTPPDPSSDPAVMPAVVKLLISKYPSLIILALPPVV